MSEPKAPDPGYQRLVEQVRGLWNQGLTTARIGQELGVTKNVVIGISHRYPGFAKRRSPIRNIPKAEVEAVVKEADAHPGKGYRQIADLAGVAPYTAMTVLRRERPNRMADRSPASAPRNTLASPVSDGPAPVSGAAVHHQETLTPLEPVRTPSALQERSAPTIAAKPPTVPDFRPSPTQPFQVQHRTCSWPIGEPRTASFRYCGEPRAMGSYCEQHARIAVAPPRVRKEAAR